MQSLDVSRIHLGYPQPCMFNSVSCKLLSVLPWTDKWHSHTVLIICGVVQRVLLCPSNSSLRLKHDGAQPPSFLRLRQSCWGGEYVHLLSSTCYSVSFVHHFITVNPIHFLLSYTYAHTRTHIAPTHPHAHTHMHSRVHICNDVMQIHNIIYTFGYICRFKLRSSRMEDGLLKKDLSHCTHTYIVTQAYVHDASRWTYKPHCIPHADSWWHCRHAFSHLPRIKFEISKL